MQRGHLNPSISFSEITAFTLSCKALRNKLGKEFDLLFGQYAQWQSNNSILFLQRAVEELNAKLTRLKTMFDCLDEAISKSSGDKSRLEESKCYVQEEMKTLKDHHFRAYEESLLERLLTLCPEKINDKGQGALSGLQIDFVLLSDAEAASKLSLQDILLKLMVRSRLGMNGSVGRGFCRVAYKEIKRRIVQHDVLVDDSRLQSIVDYFKQDKATYDLYTEAANAAQYIPMANAFRKIYRALHDGQSGPDIIKTNFLSEKESDAPSVLIRRVIRYAKDYPFSRTAKTWELTKRHYQQCTPKNRPLFTAIYKWSFAQSGTFFKISNVFTQCYFSSSAFARQVAELSDDQILQGAVEGERRTGRIYRALC